ncbi:hypothetical protein, partial [Paracoccus sanguinis]|uniref:hypothetical protein n=1 Tax=Paracoccus sanguinis TaxID=1545044 RepID=UPI001C0FB430
MRIASAVLLAAVLGLAACGPDPAAQVAPPPPAPPPPFSHLPPHPAREEDGRRPLLVKKKKKKKKLLLHLFTQIDTKFHTLAYTPYSDGVANYM